MRATMTQLTSLPLLAGAIACGSAPHAKPEISSPPDRISGDTRTVFRLRCAPCHGDQGRGDGASAWHLRPKPGDFSLEAWQRETSDAHIERAIVEGGMAIGLSSVMPAHPDLYGKGGLVELRLLLRSFAEPKRTLVAEREPLSEELPVERSLRVKARRVFEARCAPCHGLRGRSDGPASGQLRPRPPDFSLISWQSKTTDEHIMGVVAEGGGARGLSSAMPGHPDIKSGLLKGLVQLIRSFSATQPEPKPTPEDER